MVWMRRYWRKISVPHKMLDFSPFACNNNNIPDIYLPFPSEVWTAKF
jgi:hypothetical protein